jgi:excisionase family DNA binding protein
MLICLVMGSDEHLLSADDVARLCGLSRKAVYRAIERGELRAFRLCSRLRIEPSAVDAWLERSVVKPSEPVAVPYVPPIGLPEPAGLRRFL